MLRPRIIPSLLIHKGGLIKTRGFGDPKYVGDPINAVKIFNEKEADELTVWDIDASANGAEPDYGLIAKLAAECRMPLCYGGGIKTAEQALRIIDLGVEKVSISSAALADPSLIGRIAESTGRQSVVAVIDVRKQTGFLAKGYEVATLNGKQKHKVDPLDLALTLQEAGAGEIVINAIDRDGQMQGFDLDLAEKMSARLGVPLTMLGGAGSLDHMTELFARCGIVGAAAGSLFVFKGPYRAVLISYPTDEQKSAIFKSAGLN